jgi:hypothetical protein
MEDEGVRYRLSAQQRNAKLISGTFRDKPRSNASPERSDARPMAATRGWVHRSEGGAAETRQVTGETVMSNDLQIEVDRLISIAHLHALNALSQPESQRDEHLAFCRGFWKHYAAAFATDETQCDRFADTLDHATRDLIAELQQAGTPVQMSGVLRLTADGAEPSAGPSSAMTLEELRPIFRKIIEQ